MKLLMGGRASGKSTQSVRWLAQNPGNRIVLCADQPSRRYLVNIARQCFPDINVQWDQRILAVESARALAGRGDVEVMVDELDKVLSILLGHKVDAGTMTGELELLGNRPVHN